MRPKTSFSRLDFWILVALLSSGAGYAFSKLVSGSFWLSILLLIVNVLVVMAVYSKRKVLWRVWKRLRGMKSSLAITAVDRFAEDVLNS